MPAETSPARPGWSYLPALDGVRAFAVAAVVMFHFWPDLFGGGFVGVDAFFVLSGFLITGMILAEVEGSGRLDLGAFWGRRVRRLVPAVIVLVIVCAVAVAIAGTGSARGLVDSIGALTWTTNWLELWFRSSRWFVIDDRTVLDHLWSLAIEEQFYLVWPPVLWWLWRRGPSRRVLVWSISALGAVSAAIMWNAGPIIGYFRTDARAFELLGGAALAASGFRPGRRWSAVLVAAGALVLVVYVPLGNPEAAALYPWGFLGLTAAFTAIVAGCIDPPRPVAAVLTQPVVRHLGQVSYGIYLWHIPVLRIMSEARLGFTGPVLHLARFAVLAVLVEASHRFVETPIRRGRLAFGPPRLAWAYAVAAVSLVAFIPGAASSLDRQWDTTVALPDVSDPGDLRVLVVGDLLGSMVGAGLARDDGLAVFEVADLECSFVPFGVLIDGAKRLRDDPYCRNWERRWRDAAEEFDPEVAVLSSGFWDTLPREFDGEVVAPAGVVMTARYEVAANRQIDLLASVAPQVVVVTLGDLSGLAAPGQRAATDRRADLIAWNEALAAAARRYPGVTLIELDRARSAQDLARRAETDLAPRIGAIG